MVKVMIELKAYKYKSTLLIMRLLQILLKNQSLKMMADVIVKATRLEITLIN